jgi:hypothetical protein
MSSALNGSDLITKICLFINEFQMKKLASPKISTANTRNEGVGVPDARYKMVCSQNLI